MSKSKSSNEAYAWYIRFIFFFQRKHYGQILNSSKQWAKSPKVFLGLSLLFRALDRKRSPIPAALRSLIIVRVSQLNGCSFCIDLNTSILIERGISMDKLLVLSNWKRSDLFDAREKATLEYTESLTISKTVSKSLNEKMRQFYSSEEMVEIAGLIAFQNMSTLFNNAFDIEAQGFCSLSSY
jgi:AhpD family alkylhydroperoxidase